jgi:hypothetical protein
MRLIDADALKDFYGKWSNNHTEFLKPEIDRYIDMQPTIEIEPKRGKWDWNGKHWECSNCRHDRLHDLVLGLDAAYCPYCGADMKYGVEE